MTKPVDIAVERICANVNDATSQRLIQLWNTVDDKTFADTWWALSQITAHLLSEVPSELRESTWEAFIRLTVEHYSTLRLTQSATGRPN